MTLLEIARADSKRILSDTTEWAVPITFTKPDQSQTVIVNGTHTKHHRGINGETGQHVNTKNASVTVSENQFTALSFSIRDNVGEVSVRGYLVSVVDSTGVLCNYVVNEWFSDESLGLIVFILGDL